MAVKFINMTEQDFLQDNLIYKYCSLENCLEMIDKTSLWFANPATWQDPFESMFLTAEYQLPSGVVAHHPWQQRVFGTCMTETATSEAYWNIYSRKQIGMSMAIKRNVLLQELRAYSQRTNTHIYIGKVEYQKTAELVNPDLRSNPFISPHINQYGIKTAEAKVRLLLLKRSSYRYENEIRFFIVKREKILSNGIFMNYQCTPTDLIKTITIDPNVGDNVFKLIKDKLVSQYNFTHFNVKKSLLYTAPVNKTFVIRR